MIRNRGNALFAAAMAALVATNVLLYLYLPSHGDHHATTAAAPAVRSHHRSTFKPPKVAGARARARAHGQVAAAGPVAVHAIRGPSWILVRRGSSTGPVVYEGVVPAGTTMRFTGHALFMRLGAVANVDVHLGRELVDIRCSAAGGVLLTEGVAVAAGPTSCPVPGS